MQPATRSFRPTRDLPVVLALLAPVPALAECAPHALGLKDLQDPYGQRCAGRIMSYTSTRSVESEDCRALKAVWQPARTRHEAPSRRRVWGPEPRAR